MLQLAIIKGNEFVIGAPVERRTTSKDMHLGAAPQPECPDADPPRLDRQGNALLPKGLFHYVAFDVVMERVRDVQERASAAPAEQGTNRFLTDRTRLDDAEIGRQERATERNDLAYFNRFSRENSWNEIGLSVTPPDTVAGRDDLLNGDEHRRDRLKNEAYFFAGAAFFSGSAGFSGRG